MVTAITLNLALACGLVVYGWWAAGAIARGMPWALVLVALPGAYLGLFVLVTLVWFAITWIWGVTPPPQARLSVARTWRLFRDEVVALVGSGTRMGLAWWVMREPRARNSDSPVLLLHGVLCNAGVWLRMRRSLRGAGIGPVYTLSYGPPLASIEHFADQVAARIDTIRADTGAARVSIVGHSMGGLVARAYIRKYGTDHVERVITIGTPHCGSVHAWMFFGRSLAQLRPGNPWLAKLNAQPLPDVRILSIWSWHDSMVAPQYSACLPGAANVALSGVAHNALVRDREVARIVAAELRSAPGATSIAGHTPTSECPGSAARRPSARR